MSRAQGKEESFKESHYEDLDVDGRTLKWILEKQDEVCGLDSSGSG
jgi:hypothetical protein